MQQDIPVILKKGFEIVENLHFCPGAAIRIGRDPSAEISLELPGISRRHATLRLGPSTFEIDDTSQNGIFVDSSRLEATTCLPYGTTLDIPPFRLIVGAAAPDTTRAASEFCARVLTRLVEHIDLDVLDRSAADLRPRIEAALERIALDEGVPSGMDLDAAIRDLADEALGLGPLEKLMGDDSVSEIMVIEPDAIFAERSGRLEKTGLSFTSEKAVRTVIDRIIAPLGRRIDELSPMVDARLADGSRVNVVVPPSAVRGACITIRKFTKTPLVMSDLIRFGSLTEEMASLLERAVESRANIVISGGTGSGKTTLLGVLSNAIPDGERIVTIEDAAELRLGQAHVVSLESRPANAEGKGCITIRELVRNALRMRPDRIVVGECRGGEALDMLQAMNTGHDGSLTTLHANSPREALSRLETLCLMAGVTLPSRAIREQIAAAVHLIVQQTRMGDGTRRITAISEVTGIEDDGEIQTQDLFRFLRDPESETEGFTPTGRLPLCIPHSPSGGRKKERTA